MTINTSLREYNNGDLEILVKRGGKRDTEVSIKCRRDGYINFLFDLITDPLTKNRGIDWSRDFRYCREVGLP